MQINQQYRENRCIDPSAAEKAIEEISCSPLSVSGCFRSFTRSHPVPRDSRPFSQQVVSASCSLAGTCGLFLLPWRLHPFLQPDLDWTGLGGAGVRGSERAMSGSHRSTLNQRATHSGLRGAESVGVVGGGQLATGGSRNTAPPLTPNSHTTTTSIPESYNIPLKRRNSASFMSHVDELPVAMPPRCHRGGFLVAPPQWTRTGRPTP